MPLYYTYLIVSAMLAAFAADKKKWGWLVFFACIFLFVLLTSL